MKRKLAAIVSAALLSGCLPSSFEDTDSSLSSILDAIEPEEYAPRDQSYQDALDTLFDLGVFEFDSEDLDGCEAEDLVPFSHRRLSAGTSLSWVQELVEDKSGDEVFELMIELSEQPINELNKKYGLSGVETIEQSEAVTLELIAIAAERDNAEALNEVGAAHLYCYLGVEQNIEQAVAAFKKSAGLGDPLAKMSLGKIYFEGIGGYHRPDLGKSLQDESFEAYLDTLRAARDQYYQDKFGQ